MTIYVLTLAVLFEGAIHIFVYGHEGRPVEFPSKAACERELKIQEKAVPGLLQGDATLKSILCVERKTAGV